MRVAIGPSRRPWLLRASRLAAVVVAGTLLSGIVLSALATPLSEVRRQFIDRRSPASGWTLDRIIVDSAAVGVLVVMGALVLLLALNILGAAVSDLSPRLDALAASITPQRLRRAVLTVCGLALTAPTLATTAHADDCRASGSSDRQPGPAVAGLPLPDLPSTPRLAASLSPPSQRLATVTVHPGDSLWSIARRGLPPDATDFAVATRVNRLYADNRQTIGDNPDLIFPGQQLIAPGGAT